jgi:hypothetical protein
MSKRQQNNNKSSSSSSAAKVRFILQTPCKNSTGKPTNSSWCFTGGYAGLFGELCDLPEQHMATTINESESKIVPSAYKEKQRNRDGNAYHMTIMLKKDLEQAAKVIDEVYSTVIEQIRQKEKLPAKFDTDAKLRVLYVLSEVALSDDYQILGVGRVKKDTEEAYFRVVKWPSVNTFLKKVGLAEKDLHITVGFKENDIHNVAKNEHTIVQE